MSTGHIFAEQGSRYNLRCVGCGISSLDTPAVEQPCTVIRELDWVLSEGHVPPQLDIVAEARQHKHCPIAHAGHDEFISRLADHIEYLRESVAAALARIKELEK